jgi:hypothetical protein
MGFNILLRFHLYINVTYFTYIYSVSVVKGEISTLMIYIVSVFVVVVQCPDVGTIL